MRLAAHDIRVVDKGGERDVLATPLQQSRNGRGVTRFVVDQWVAFFKLVYHCASVCACVSVHHGERVPSNGLRGVTR